MQSVLSAALDRHTATDAALFSFVRLLGLSIRKTPHGEYRITLRCPNNTRDERAAAEYAAYYTDDRQDAAATALNFFRGWRGPQGPSCTVTPAATELLASIAAQLDREKETRR